MKPHHILTLIGSLIFSGVLASDEAKIPVVVISQIVEHEALNKEREGLLSALKDAGYENGQTVRIIYQNAQGNITTSAQIADSFASAKPDVAVGISTPSAQSLVQPMGRLGVPIVFAAVTDPVEARLVTSLGKHKENVTGVSDGIPLKPQFEFIKKLIPGLKTVGVLYNPGEANSSKTVRELQTLLPKMGLSLVLATTSKTADTLMAAQSLVGKVEIIFIPLDNTVMASIVGVVALGRTHKIPIFTPDVDSVEQGILAVRAPSHKAMGYKAGQLVARILKGEKASDIPVVVDTPLELSINMKSADSLGIVIPPEVKKDAKLIS